MDEPQAPGSAGKLPKIPVGFLWLRSELAAHDLRGWECVRGPSGSTAPAKTKTGWKWNFGSGAAGVLIFQSAVQAQTVWGHHRWDIYHFYPRLFLLALSCCLLLPADPAPPEGSTSKGKNNAGLREFLQILLWRGSARSRWDQEFCHLQGPCSALGVFFPLMFFPMFFPSPQVAFRLDFEFSKSVFLQSMEILMVASRSGNALSLWNH